MKMKYLAVLAAMSAMLIGMSIMPAPVIAQVEFDVGPGGVRIGRPGDDRRYYRDDERRYYRDDRRYEQRYARPGCSPRQALAEAKRYVNDPWIRSMNPSFYEIEGCGKRGGKRNRPDGVRISTKSNCERT